MDGAKLFARAHDLFCFDKIDLQDPEALGAVRSYDDSICIWL